MPPGNLSHILAPVNAGRKIQEGVSHVIELLEVVVCGLRGWVVESEGDVARQTVIVRTQPYVVCHHWTNLAQGNFVHLGKTGTFNITSNHTIKGLPDASVCGFTYISLFDLTMLVYGFIYKSIIIFDVT